MRRVPTPTRPLWYGALSSALSLVALAALAESPPLDVTGMTFISSRAEETELTVHAEQARFRPDADVAELDVVRARLSTG